MEFATPHTLKHMGVVTERVGRRVSVKTNSREFLVFNFNGDPNPDVGDTVIIRFIPFQIDRINGVGAPLRGAAWAVERILKEAA